MRVVIVGGHGKIALHLTGRLVARGVGVLGVIRRQDQAADIQALGGKSAVSDIENASVSELAEVIGGADAVLFAAGAGAGSGAERKLTVDRDGAIKALQASVAAGVPRYLIVSSVGAEDPPDGDDVFSVYLRAKAEADAAVQASETDWTILRPGRLTDDPGRGRVRVSRELVRGEIPREDVAAVLDELLQIGRPSRAILYVNGGEDPIDRALEDQV